MSIDVSVVIDACAKPATALDQRDLQTGLGQHIGGDTAAWAASDNAYVEDLFRHRESPVKLRLLSYSRDEADKPPLPARAGPHLASQTSMEQARLYDELKCRFAG